MFCLQALTIFVGNYTLWGGYVVSLFPSYGGILDCIYIMYVVLRGIIESSMHHMVCFFSLFWRKVLYHKVLFFL